MLFRSIGYSNLVESWLGLTIDKGARFTDWSRRPLTERQIEYAIGDVTHLSKIFPRILKRLIKTGRGYRSSQELTFHCDSADVTALFVLRTAMTGGMSGFASSVAVHNEVVRRDPELAAILYQPFHWSLLGQEQPGEAPYYQQPIFHMQDGYFSQRFVRAMIYGAEKHVGAPPMSAKQRAALDLLCDVADNSPYSFRMMLAPGDLEILNNHTTMHARTEFKDHGTHDTNRHLLRLWLSMPNSRPLSPLMNYIYRDQTPGSVRGGFRAHGNRRIMETPL